MEGPSLEQYNAERAVHLWWTEGQRQRRPEFALHQVQNADDEQEQEDRLLNYLLANANVWKLEIEGSI